MAPLALNAANEVAVGCFLDGALGFDRTQVVIAATLDAMNPSAADSLEVVLEADRWAREFAAGHIRKSLR